MESPKKIGVPSLTCANDCAILNLRRINILTWTGLSGCGMSFGKQVCEGGGWERQRWKRMEWRRKGWEERKTASGGGGGSPSGPGHVGEAGECEGLKHFG